ncbi:MAG: hypothetical protein Q9170_008221, partial [Blastenia crenularia]
MVPHSFEQQIRQILGAARQALDREEDISDALKTEVRRLAVKIAGVVRTTSSTDILLERMTQLSERDDQQAEQISEMRRHNMYLEERIQQLETGNAGGHRRPGQVHHPGFQSLGRAGRGGLPVHNPH